MIRAIRPFVTHLLWGLFASLPLQGVEVRQVNRASIHATEATEITLLGNEIRSQDGTAAQLWCSFPAAVEVVDPENKDRNRVTFRITPEHAIEGLVAIRAYDHESVSRPFLFFAQRGPSINVSQVSDKPLTLPVRLDGETRNLADLKIPLNCKKGEPFVAEMLASRIGSEIDGVLILQDQDEKELVFSDDGLATGSDPVLMHVPSYDGLHYLIVRDVEYRGSQRFQLNVRQQSTTAICVPSVVKIGETRSIQTLPVLGAADAKPLIVRTSSSSQIGFGLLAFDDFIASVRRTHLPVYTESASAPLPIPSVFSGKLEEPEEVDQTQFAAKQGDQLVIDHESCSGPIVPAIRLLSSAGALVAEHHWGRDANGKIRHSIPADDVYRLEIRDVLNRGGAAFSYAFSIRNDVSPATLKIATAKQRKKRRFEQPHRMCVDSGKSLPVLVRVDRRGEQGPIKIHAEADGRPLEVSGLIEANKNEGTIEIAIPKIDDSAEVWSLSIYGTCGSESDSDGRGFDKRVVMDLSEHQRRDFPKFSPLPALASGVTLLVLPTEEKSK